MPDLFFTGPAFRRTVSSDLQRRGTRLTCDEFSGGQKLAGLTEGAPRCCDVTGQVGPATQLGRRCVFRTNCWGMVRVKEILKDNKAMTVLAYSNPRKSTSFLKPTSTVL